MYNDIELTQKIDEFFDENEPKKAEQFMLEQLEIAEACGDDGIALKLLNELMGYYRQTSEKENMLDVIDRALKLCDKMNIKDDILYATTTINVANANRAIGELETSKHYYDIAEKMYDQKIETNELDENDMLVAALYNNISLMYQEMSNYKKALQYLKRALMISTYNNAEFEVAITYANIANTYILAKNYDQAKTNANKSISLFKAAGIVDPHYCAALSALGTCYFEEGQKDKARKIFMDASNIVENTFGRNSQYMKLQTNIEMCGEENEEHLRGMELSQKYYEQYVAPMVSEKFVQYEGKIAVGLVGEGSDCFGFDDDISVDHDFGPDVCMWLDDETYEAIGKELAEEYSKLPHTFMGHTRNTTKTAADRRGVMRISDFYQKFTGTKDGKNIDYTQVLDYSLACSVNGQVFRDDEGLFSSIRERIKAGYPANVRLLKLAEDCANYAQCGMYNYSRMKQRNDELTASIMIADCCKYAMKLYHHIMNVYPPHDKWLHQSTLKLEGGDKVIYYIEAIMNKAANGEPVQNVEAVLEQLGTHIANILYANCDISDVDPFLEHHVDELIFKSGICNLSKEELADRIARIEFEAFDKVENEGGRASCQNDWPTFYVMRKSQYMTWNETMLVQYLYDFTREYNNGHNLITEKYGRMMESTDPQRYMEIKDNFPTLSEEKKSVIEQIVAIQMNMMEQFASKYPKSAGNARILHTSEDEKYDTSYETYLRGEISTYSDKMLQLYGMFVVGEARQGGNIALKTIENTAKLYGFDNIDDFENKAE